MIEHVVSLARPERRSVRVTLRCELPEGTSTQELVFPVWTPGSYLVREHPRHVHDLAATGDGRPLTVTKTAKNVYRVDSGGARRLEATWEVYAHELTVRTNHVDTSHAFLNPVAMLPFLPGRLAESHRLSFVDVPEGWGVACALETDGADAFLAADYDELVDSPIEAGPHAAAEARTSFEAAGVRHELVFWGRSALDRTRFTDDVRRIAEAQAALFGGLPYPRYLFIVHASDSGRGGLEHRASAALLYPRASLEKKHGYEDLLGLVSHELFHAWNVKRIKPEAFAPYDYTRENHTRQLWAFEGLTSYYEDLFLVRAGLMSRQRYLEVLAERMTALERIPGRRRHPVEESSFDAWIRLYRQDENTDDSTVSYYLKGSLVGALVDLALRDVSQGKHSLDDVMRDLFTRFAARGEGVPEGGVREAIEQLGGERLRDLLETALRTTEELPLEPLLATHGVRVRRRVAHGHDDKGGPTPKHEPIRAFHGLVLRGDGPRVKVHAVRRDSPAERAGVAPGDELVAIDGLRAEPSTAVARLAAADPGQTIRLALFRRDELVECALTPVEAPADTFSVDVDPEATPAARALLEEWLPVKASEAPAA